MQKRKSKRNRRGRKDRKGLNGARQMVGWNRSIIPMYDPAHEVRRIIRYQCQTSGGTFNICGAGLLDSMFVATGSTTGYRIFTAFKIHSVRMWTSGSQSTTSNTGVQQTIMALEWITKDYQKDSKIEVNPLGTQVASLLAIPPVDSQSSWWVASTGALDGYVVGGGSIFNIQCGIGTIIDLEASWIMVDDESAVSVARTLSGATAGKFYYSSLDVTASGGGNLVPQSVNTV